MHVCGSAGHLVGTRCFCPELSGVLDVPAINCHCAVYIRRFGTVNGLAVCGVDVGEFVFVRSVCLVASEKSRGLLW